MKDFKRIIEQFRREKYFLYDVAYTEFDCRSVSIDEKMYIEIDRKRNVPKNLFRLLGNHLNNGLKLKPVKADISFKSYTQKVPDQCDNKLDNRYDYSIEVDFENRRAVPSKHMRESSNVKKIYEDFERIFGGCGWQFND